MDQVRTALAWLKKHHFWVLTGLVVLIALGCWWGAAKKMSAKYEADQKTIKGGFDTVESVKSASFHPNDTINNQEIGEIQKLSKGVAKLWQVLYDKQRENVLQWPTAAEQSIPRRRRKNAVRRRYPSRSARQLPKLHRTPLPRAAEANQRAAD